MKEELREIIKLEIDAIQKLLESLEAQHSALLKSDAIVLENCINEIEDCNRGLAAAEVKRRELTNGRPMSEVINELNDNGMDDDYRRIKGLLEEVKLQKDTNDLLIKQGLSFTNRLLSIFNPSRAQKTYNSFGKFSR